MSTRSRLDTIERRLESVYTALVVRDPGTALSADAYEGLRKQVIASAQSRLAHLAQLAELDLALRRGATLDTLRELSSQWLKQAGVATVEDPSERDLFESTLQPGDIPVVQLPAYVDEATGRVLRQGRLRGAAPEPSVARPDRDEPESSTAGES